MPAESTRDFLRARPWTASCDAGVPTDLDLPETSLVHMLERSVARHGGRTALEFFGARTTYADLGLQVERAAEGLRRLGVRRGDRVAIVWDRAAERVRSLPAGSPADAVVDITAAMPGAQQPALRLPLPAVRASRAQLTGPAPGTIPWPQLLAADPIAVEHPRPTAHDLALLQCTSGTTGLPKGAMLPHRNLESNALMGRHWLGSTEHEVVHGVLPLFHALGLTLG